MIQYYAKAVNVRPSVFRELDRLVDSEQGRQLLDNYKNREQVMEHCNEEMYKTLAAVRNRGWLTHEPIWNACFFVNNVALDHSILICDLMTERRVTRRRLVGRNLSVLLFELLEDVPAVFGRAFRDSVNDLRLDSSLMTPLNRELKKISKFRNKYSPILKQIRTIAGAHRDHDAILLHETTVNMNLGELLQIALTVGNGLNSIGPPAQAIMTASSMVKPPEL